MGFVSVMYYFWFSRFFFKKFCSTGIHFINFWISVASVCLHEQLMICIIFISILDQIRTYLQVGSTDFCTVEPTL